MITDQHINMQRNLICSLKEQAKLLVIQYQKEKKKKKQNQVITEKLKTTGYHIQRYSNYYFFKCFGCLLSF